MLSSTSNGAKELLFYCCEEPRQEDALEKACRKVQCASLFSRGGLVCASQNQLTPSLTDTLKGPSNQEQKSEATEAQGLRSRLRGSSLV